MVFVGVVDTCEGCESLFACSRIEEMTPGLDGVWQRQGGEAWMIDRSAADDDRMVLEQSQQGWEYPANELIGGPIVAAADVDIGEDGIGTEARNSGGQGLKYFAEE